VFSGHGKQSCWKTIKNHPHLVQGIGHDGELAPIEQFVCHLHDTPEQATVNNARLQLFGKAKHEMLPPTRDALELHTAHTNYQAKIWLHGRPGAYRYTFLLSTTSLHGRWSQTA